MDERNTNRNGHLHELLVLLVEEEPPHPLRVDLDPLPGHPADALYRREGRVHRPHDPPRRRRVRREEDLAPDERLHLAPQEPGQPEWRRLAANGVKL